MSLGVVEVASKAQLGFHDQMCFHSQQAVEKYLKALMLEAGLHVPRSYELDYLLRLLLRDYPVLRPLDSLRHELKRMSRYATEFGDPGITARASQAKSARRLALRVRETIRPLLGLDEPPRQPKP